jgi:hypothetical protein
MKTEHAGLTKRECLLGLDVDYTNGVYQWTKETRWQVGVHDTNFGGSVGGCWGGSTYDRGQTRYDELAIQLGGIGTKARVHSTGVDRNGTSLLFEMVCQFILKGRSPPTKQSNETRLMKQLKLKSRKN